MLHYKRWVFTLIVRKDIWGNRAEIHSISHLCSTGPPGACPYHLCTEPSSLASPPTLQETPSTADPSHSNAGTCTGWGSLRHGDTLLSPLFSRCPVQMKVPAVRHPAGTVPAGSQAKNAAPKSRGHTMHAVAMTRHTFQGKASILNHLGHLSNRAVCSD